LLVPCFAAQLTRLVLVAGFALMFLCNRSKLEGALPESADDLHHRPPPHRPTYPTINKDYDQGRQPAMLSALDTWLGCFYRRFG
jgi:hypothetical protein